MPALVLDAVGAPVINPGVVGTIDDIPGLTARMRVDRVVVSLSDQRGKLPMAQLLDVRLQSGVLFPQARESGELLAYAPVTRHQHAERREVRRVPRRQERGPDARDEPAPPVHPIPPQGTAVGPVKPMHSSWAEGPDHGSGFQPSISILPRHLGR